MAEFKVNTGKLQSNASSTQKLSNDIGKIIDEISQISNQLGIKGSIRNDIRRQLNSCIHTVSEQKGKMLSLSSALSEASNTYEEYENNASNVNISQGSLMGLNDSFDINPKFNITVGEIGQSIFDPFSLFAISVENKDSNGTNTRKISFLNNRQKISIKSNIDFTKGNVNPLEAKLKDEFSVLQYENNFNSKDGNQSGKIDLSVGNAVAEGAVGVSFIRDGKIDPALYGKLKTEVSLLKGKAEGQYGSDDRNVHGELKASVMSAEAKAEVQAGKIVDEDGSAKIGVSAEAGAEAYYAKGSVGGGFTVSGIKFDLSVEGEAGGAGAKIGGELSTGSISGEIGAGLIFGFKVKAKIDWSDFDPVSTLIEGTKGAIDTAVDGVKNAADNVGNALSEGINVVKGLIHL